ncbi:MAG TPA: biopolymer transporter ExbD [Lysobacter sp.]|nr:biopolymer transporter ExbD [Lysobacter sp.]
MAVARPLSAERPIAAINITPLVDVMLVLLVIFMLSVPLLTRTLVTALPQSGPARPTPAEPLALDVRADGYLLEGRMHDAATLQAVLAERVRRQPDATLLLRAGGDVDYQAVATALAAAQHSGVRTIGQAP